MDGGGEGRPEALIEPPCYRVALQIFHLEAAERINQLAVLVGLEGVACQTDQASSWSQKRHYPFQMEARDASLAAMAAGGRIGKGGFITIRSMRGQSFLRTPRYSALSRATGASGNTSRRMLERVSSSSLR